MKNLETKHLQTIKEIADFGGATPLILLYSGTDISYLSILTIVTPAHACVL